jgi:hypothetical protein
MDRRKGGLKRSVATEGYGIPLGTAAAGANRHDSPLLAPTLGAAISQPGGALPGGRTCHLDAGYDSWPTASGWRPPARPVRQKPGRPGPGRPPSIMTSEQPQNALTIDRR